MAEVCMRVARAREVRGRGAEGGKGVAGSSLDSIRVAPG